MRSSTSNSKPFRYRSPLWAFGATFFILIGLGWVLNGLFPKQAWKGEFPSVSAEDRYQVMEAYSDQAFDLYGIYYGIGDSVKSAQKADVIILGNSKPFFAFRNDSVRAFSQKTGLRIFNLSVPYGDGITFAKALIEKFKLSPKILIINECHFFNPTLSPYGDETLKMGYWQAWVKIVEHEVSWFIRFHLHQLFPRFGLGKLYGAVPVVEYRSIGTGCLAMENFEQSLVPVSTRATQEEVLPPEEVQIAEQFKRETASRGTRIILTSVPYGTDEMGQLGKWVRDPDRQRFIAKAEEPYETIDRAALQLNLPVILVKADGLNTFDGRHLDEKSASEFTDLFFNELVKEPEVKSLINKRP